MLKTEKPTTLEQDDLAAAPRTLREWRTQVLDGLLRGILIFGALALAGGINNVIQDKLLGLLVIYLTAFALLALVTFMRRLGFTVRSGVLLFLLYGLGALGLSTSGLSGDGRVFLFAFIAVTAVLFDLRRGVGALVFSLLTLTGAAWVLTTGRLVIPESTLTNSTEADSWFSGTAVFLLLSVAVIIPISYLIRSLERSLADSREMLGEIRKQRKNLEQLVNERTADLEHRARQLQAAVEVGRATAGIHDPDELLSQVAGLISEQFGFYHVGIFLLDPSGEYAVLCAANSDGGRRMMARGHRLKVRGDNIIGHVIAQKEPRMVSGTGQDVVFFDNPDLPDTRVEMALPLIAAGQLLGALDVQSAQETAFTGEDVAVLQVVAGQVAAAIENARLFTESQTALETTQRALGEIGHQAWDRLLGTRPDWGYRYTSQSIAPVEGGWRPEMVQAAQAGQSVQRSIAEVSRLAIPIKVRGQAVGVLGFRKGASGETWTTDEIATLEILTEQLGQAVEIARLYQETQRRAEREQLTGEIAARIRETLDIETVLKTAAEEVRQALELPEVAIRLGGSVSSKQ